MFPLSKADLEKKLNRVLKINGSEISEQDAPVDISYCELADNGDYNEITADESKVAAICLKYKSGSSVKAGDVLTVSLEDKNENKIITSDQFSIEFKEARRINKLQLKEKSISAAPEAEVTNAVTLIDQYEDPIELGEDQGLQVRVTKDNKDVEPGNIRIGEVKDGVSHVQLSENGIYNVIVYVAKKNKEDGFESYTTNLIQDSYTLEIDTMGNLINTIGISDEVTKQDETVVDLSEVECMRMNDDSKTSLKFNYKAFDKNGKEIVGTIDGNELSWSVSGTNATATIDSLGNVTIQEMADNTSGSIQINLVYARKSLSASKSVKVSNEASKPKAGTYRIVIPKVSDSDKPATEDEPIKTAEGETNLIAGETTYKVTAQDQYGDLMYVSNLSAVYADDVAVASVEKESDRFIVHAISEKTTKINVLLATGETLSFAVKGIMKYAETDITAEWKKKAEDFGNAYYNEGDTDVQPDICYFTIPYSGDSSSVSVTSVKLGDEELLENKEIPISVGNNRFVELENCIVDENTKNLMISYVFVALHNTNAANKMIFTVTFSDDTQSSAVLKVKDMQDNLYCTNVEAAYLGEKGGTVKVDNLSKEGEKVTGCGITLTKESTMGWNHLVYFSFSKPSGYYFTKKVYNDGSVSYGFTEAENKDGVLGYFPPRYGSLKRTTHYTVATVDRHGVAEIELEEKNEDATIEP